MFTSTELADPGKLAEALSFVGRVPSTYGSLGMPTIGLLPQVLCQPTESENHFTPKAQERRFRPSPGVQTGLQEIDHLKLNNKRMPKANDRIKAELLTPTEIMKVTTATFLEVAQFLINQEDTSDGDKIILLDKYSQLTTNTLDCQPEYSDLDIVALNQQLANDGVPCWMLTSQPDLLQSIPCVPGIYILTVSPAGSTDPDQATVVYLGKTENLSSRIRSYLGKIFPVKAASEAFKGLNYIKLFLEEEALLTAGASACHKVQEWQVTSGQDAKCKELFTAIQKGCSINAWCLPAPPGLSPKTGKRFVELVEKQMLARFDFPNNICSNGAYRHIQVKTPGAGVRNDSWPQQQQHQQHLKCFTAVKHLPHSLRLSLALLCKLPSVVLEFLLKCNSIPVPVPSKQQELQDLAITHLLPLWNSNEALVTRLVSGFTGKPAGHSNIVSQASRDSILSSGGMSRVPAVAVSAASQPIISLPCWQDGFWRSAKKAELQDYCMWHGLPYTSKTKMPELQERVQAHFNEGGA